MSNRISRFAGTRFMCEPPPSGFGIRFYVDDEAIISATVVFDESKQGADGILHGGAIAAVLDEAMGIAAYENGVPGFTVTMTYNYKTHIPLGQEIRVRAWVDRIEGRKVFAACDVKLADGTLAVDGTGIFIQSEKLKQQLDANPYIPDSDN